jgi:hypothetical protein
MTSLDWEMIQINIVASMMYAGKYFSHEYVHTPLLQLFELWALFLSELTLVWSDGLSGAGL